MPFSRNRHSGKRKYLAALVPLLLIFAICTAFIMTDSGDFDIARREVLLRRIGHEILLQSGDSLSRVLPVKRISDNDYQINFEHALTFQTDSLVNITRRVLADDPFASDCVVNVLNCGHPAVVYGYAISKDKKDDIVSCIGRKQPVACYKIDIKFKPNGITAASNTYFIGGLSFLVFAGFVFLRSVKPRSNIAKHGHNEMFAFGSVVFDAQRRQLQMHDNITDLTGTETRLLLIFALSPNKTVERSRLQKEIWEDEGVVVGRSLDMFISKLRKKLAPDPDINIVVVRGKGYKLEVRA